MHWSAPVWWILCRGITKAASINTRGRGPRKEGSRKIGEPTSPIDVTGKAMVEKVFSLPTGSQRERKGRGNPNRNGQNGAYQLWDRATRGTTEAHPWGGNPTRPYNTDRVTEGQTKGQSVPLITADKKWKRWQTERTHMLITKNQNIINHQWETKP